MKKCDYSVPIIIPQKRNRNSCKRKTVILPIYNRLKMVYTNEKGGEKHDSDRRIT